MDIRYAIASDLPRLVDLQAHVLASLPADQAYFIVPKTEAQFRHYLATAPEEQVYIGRVDGQHAAQLALRFDIGGAEQARHTTALAHLGFGTILPRYALIQGALVDPAFRGRHLLRAMLDHVTPLAAKGGAVFMLARIVPANLASIISFLESGYQVVAAARDPDDEREVYYLYKDLSAQVIFAERCESPSQDFAATARLTQDGWRATRYIRASNLLVFER